MAKIALRYYAVFSRNLNRSLRLHRKSPRGVWELGERSGCGFRDEMVIQAQVHSNKWVQGVSGYGALVRFQDRGCVADQPQQVRMPPVPGRTSPASYCRAPATGALHTVAVRVGTRLSGYLRRVFHSASITTVNKPSKRRRPGPPHNPGVRELVANKRGYSSPPKRDDAILGFSGWHESGRLPHRDEPGLIQFVTSRTIHRKRSSCLIRRIGRGAARGFVMHTEECVSDGPRLCRRPATAGSHVPQRQVKPHPPLFAGPLRLVLRTQSRSELDLGCV